MKVGTLVRKVAHRRSDEDPIPCGNKVPHIGAEGVVIESIPEDRPGEIAVNFDGYGDGTCAPYMIVEREPLEQDGQR